MEVILLERVEKLGAIGDVVKVKDGFARNYLLPRKKALRANEANRKLFEANRARIESDNAERRTGAEAAAKELGPKNGLQINILWLTPPQEDGQVQAQRIQQAVNDGADAILISCSDAGKVTGAINDAVARGVEVMTFDSDVPGSSRFANSATSRATLATSSSCTISTGECM